MALQEDIDGLPIRAAVALCLRAAMRIRSSARQNATRDGVDAVRNALVDWCKGGAVDLRQTWEDAARLKDQAHEDTLRTSSLEPGFRYAATIKTAASLAWRQHTPARHATAAMEMAKQEAVAVESGFERDAAQYKSIFAGADRESPVDPEVLGF